MIECDPADIRVAADKPGNYLEELKLELLGTPNTKNHLVAGWRIRAWDFQIRNPAP